LELVDGLCGNGASLVPKLTSRLARIESLGIM